MNRSRAISDAGEQYLVVGGQELRLTNPERVLSDGCVLDGETVP